MHVEFDRDTCIGMYQCVAEYDAFEKNPDEGKADLAGAEEVEPDLFELAVPEGAALDAEMAARACPVDAIALYDDDGEQVV
jgi:ferredoxin